jgi:hypothetical protein
MSTAPVQKTKRIKLTRSSNEMMMTPKEFDAVTEYDDRFVYELIHGVLIVSPASGVTERDPNGELEFLLRAHPFAEYCRAADHFIPGCNRKRFRGTGSRFWG